MAHCLLAPVALIVILNFSNNYSDENLAFLIAILIIINRRN